MGEKVSKLLINESPLQVLPSLVIALGGSKYLLDAIFLQQVQFWLSNPRLVIVVDDKYYVKFNYQEWADQLPWAEIETIKGVVARLKDSGVLTVIQPAGMDKTNHYGINYDALNQKLGLHDDPAEGGDDDPAEGGDGCPAEGGDVLLIKESIKTLREKPKRKPKTENQKSETYLEFEKMKQGKQNWKYRDEFLSMGEEITDLADLCVSKFGAPSNKKELGLWIAELSDWLQNSVTSTDWKPALEIIDGYSNPVLTITGITKAIKYAARERKNPQRKPKIYNADEEQQNVGISLIEARKRGIIK